MCSRLLNTWTIFVSRTDAQETANERVSVDEVLGPVDPDSNILVVGPTLSEKDSIAFDVLARSWSNDAPPFVITTTDSSPAFRSRFAPFVSPPSRVEDVYVIDCLESSQSGGSEHPPTCEVGTPADLTGIGICLSKGYDRYGGGNRRRVLVDNLSTLLIYSDVERVFRFLSTINGRITQLGDGTVQLLDRDAVDSADEHTLVQLFSTVIEVRNETDATLFRLRGDTQTPWYEYLPRQETIHQ